MLGQPDPAHLLGVDSAGRDVFSRLLFAGQFSLAGALVALVVALVIGVTRADRRLLRRLVRHGLVLARRD